MADNKDRRQQKTVWDILPILAILGSLITAWVNLNGELTTVKLQQSYNEKYNVLQYEQLQTSISDINDTLGDIKSTNDDVSEQLTDLERTVTHLYTTNKRK